MNIIFEDKREDKDLDAVCTAFGFAMREKIVEPTPEMFVAVLGRCEDVTELREPRLLTVDAHASSSMFFRWFLYPMVGVGVAAVTMVFAVRGQNSPSGSIEAITASVQMAPRVVVEYQALDSFFAEEMASDSDEDTEADFAVDNSSDLISFISVLNDYEY